MRDEAIGERFQPARREPQERRAAAAAADLAPCAPGAPASAAAAAGSGPAMLPARCRRQAAGKVASVAAVTILEAAQKPGACRCRRGVRATSRARGTKKRLVPKARDENDRRAFDHRARRMRAHPPASQGIRAGRKRPTPPLAASTSPPRTGLAQADVVQDEGTLQGVLAYRPRTRGRGRGARRSFGEADRGRMEGIDTVVFSAADGIMSRTDDRPGPMIGWGSVDIRQEPRPPASAAMVGAARGAATLGGRGLSRPLRGFGRDGDPAVDRPRAFCREVSKARLVAATGRRRDRIRSSGRTRPDIGRFACATSAPSGGCRFWLR